MNLVGSECSSPNERSSRSSGRSSGRSSPNRGSTGSSNRSECSSPSSPGDQDGLCGTGVIMTKSSFTSGDRREESLVTRLTCSCASAAAARRQTLKRLANEARMKREGYRALEAVESGGPHPQVLPCGIPVTAKFWGISRRQIEQLFRQSRRSDHWRDEDNVHQFIKKFVLPETDGTGMGMALLLNQEVPQEVNLMVSHAWTENARDFFCDVLAAMYDHEVAFICFLSNYQGSAEDIDKQLGCDIHRSPFTEVIKNEACRRMLVIPNEALRENGQGLYSRLWCDWEIKVAADAGMPINIPTRNSLGHLLGRKGNSSRKARCGDPSKPMNKDEQLIRHAIESMPPHTGRSHAVELLVVSICAAFGGPIFFRLFNCFYMWLAGFGCTTTLGLLLTWCVSNCMRPWSRDGYEVLDKVIMGAAVGQYSFRQVRARQDLLWVCAFAGCCGIAQILLEEMLYNRKAECSIVAFVEGCCWGFLLLPIVHPNVFGPWTGVFIITRAQRMFSSALLTGTSCVGIVIDILFIRKHATLSKSSGRGMLMGWMFGLFLISIVHKKWRHAINMAWMLLLTVFTGVLHTGLWRESFIVLLGLGAVQVRPDWSVEHCLLIAMVEIVALLGLYVLAESDNRDPIEFANHLHDCYCMLS